MMKTKPSLMRFGAVVIPWVLAGVPTALAEDAEKSSEIRNPLGANSIEEVLQIISSRVIDIVIPIAVLLYAWAGFNLLIAAGRPQYINKAKLTFQYTTLGLLVIFIGGGFVDLIRSILNP